MELAAVISETDATKVANLFQTDNNFFRVNRDSDHHAGVCHPLCSCQERPERESKEGASGKTHIELLAVDEDGNTPIHVAAKLGNEPNMKVLVCINFFLKFK